MSLNIFVFGKKSNTTWQKIQTRTDQTLEIYHQPNLLQQLDCLREVIALEFAERFKDKNRVSHLDLLDFYEMIRSLDQFIENEGGHVSVEYQ
jgi:hypothetical protein